MSERIDPPSDSDLAKFLRDGAEKYPNLAPLLNAAADRIERSQEFEQYYDKRMMYPDGFARKWPDAE